jgi:hypothetical protein
MTGPGFVKRPDGLRFTEALHSPYFLAIARIFGLVIIAAYAVSNYVQAGSVLAFRNPEVAFHIHTVFPFGLRFFARAGVAGVVLLYAAFWARRQRIDLLLMALVLIVPLSRLSRIDVGMGLVALAIMFKYLPLFRLSLKSALLLVCFFAVVIVGGSELGSLRQNRFGQYDFKYSTFIAWRPEIVGPSEIFPIAYGYFSLTFENLDSFVRQFRGEHNIFLFSFDWLFTGFLKLNWFSSYLYAQATNYDFTPVSSAANVPTALTPFYSDFGAVGMALPMMMYVGFWVYLYHRSRQSVRAMLVYAIYSGAFALASFQALIASAYLVHQMVQVVIVFWVVGWLERSRFRRQRLRDSRKARVAELVSR